jgi:hypothetical protein
MKVSVLCGAAGSLSFFSGGLFVLGAYVFSAVFFVASLLCLTYAMTVASKVMAEDVLRASRQLDRLLNREVSHG